MHDLGAFLEYLVVSFRAFAYAFIFLATLLETLPLVGLIVPGGLIAVFGGFLVARGSADLGDMIIVATAGAVLGDWLGYLLGRLIRFLKTVLPLERLAAFKKAELYFATRGGLSIIYGRFLPIGRGFVPIAAGVGRMPHGRFLIYNIGGGFAWAALHVIVGYLTGESWKVAGKFIGAYAPLILIAALILYYLVKYALGKFIGSKPPESA